MANYIYLIGDDVSRECVVVDPAWNVKEIIDLVEADGMNLTGALVTHYHPDHVGGPLFGSRIIGLAELMAEKPVKVHVNEHEAKGLSLVTGLSPSDMVTHSGGDKIQVGDITITLLHTPGHTPGSQCFLVGSQVISGDTLFIGSCGRVDLPGSDPEQMYHSLTQVLAKLPDSTALFPGHNYSRKTTSTIGEEKTTNFAMRMKSLDDWMKLMGRG
jgi:glyoxylase-like metal-dependent hydrolase (beta-lactamase superfamily II)